MGYAALERRALRGLVLCRDAAQLATVSISPNCEVTMAGESLYTRKTNDCSGAIMNFGQAIGSCFSNYIGFEGRAPRSEYWYWVLFTFIVAIVTAVLDRVLFPGNELSPINTLFNLAILLPSLAVLIRRLHDIDRTGWWWLLIFVPVVGWIVLIIWAIQRGDETNNRFGADPLVARAA